MKSNYSLFEMWENFETHKTKHAPCLVLLVIIVGKQDIFTLYEYVSHTLIQLKYLFLIKL